MAGLLWTRQLYSLQHLFLFIFWGDFFFFPRKNFGIQFQKTSQEFYDAKPVCSFQHSHYFFLSFNPYLVVLDVLMNIEEANSMRGSRVDPANSLRLNTIAAAV